MGGSSSEEIYPFLGPLHPSVLLRVRLFGGFDSFPFLFSFFPLSLLDHHAGIRFQATGNEIKYLLA